MNKQFCVIGNPIGHSLSPLMHNYAFECLKEELGFVGYYGRYALQNKADLARIFWDLRLEGANLTIPFKEEAFLQSDVVEGIANKIGTINTWVKKNNKIYGYNTDAEGFYSTIKDFNFNNVLILGAGGSARAIAYILQEKHINVCMLNRSSDALNNLKDFEAYSVDNFSPKGYDLIVNATSASLQDKLPFEKPLLEEILKSAKYAYDLMYGKNTPFLNLAKEYIPIQDGKAMLIAQGTLAFELFCGKKIPNVYSLMQSALK